MNPRHSKALLKVICLIGMILFLARDVLQAEELIIFTGYYNRDNAPYSNLYSMRPDGSGRTQITNFFPYSASQPALSHDGKQLAFTSNLLSFKSLNYEDIFRLELQGSKLIRVTGAEYNSEKKTGSVKVSVKDDIGDYNDNPSSLIYSFQGCKDLVTYDAYIKAGVLQDVPATNVWVKIVKNKWIGASGFVQVPAGGEETAVLGNLSDGNFLAGKPSFSPDGTKITGISGLAYFDTTALNPDGTVKEGKSPYGGFDKLMVVDLNGILIDDFKNGSGADNSPVYSPDGTRIAYSRGGITQESVVVVPANSLNGSGVVVAAKGNDYFSYPPRSWGYSSPAWSPDGSTIACAYTEYDSSFNMTSNIVLANSDGSGNIRQITSVPQNAAATSADFSPDGQWIVYSVVTSKSTVLNISDFLSYNITSDIYKKNLSTGEEVRLTNDGSSSEPSWGTAVAQPKIPTGTTTIPGGGTTTIPGGSKCPFAKNIQNEDELTVLRNVRSALREKNERLVEVFYEYAQEITGIVAADITLQAQLRKLVTKNISIVRAFSDRGTVRVKRSSVQEVTGFLREIKAQAAPGLAVVLDTLIRDIEQGGFLKDNGVYVEP